MNMKKVTSVALTAALAASLAVSASAVSVGHAHDECSVWNDFVTNTPAVAGNTNTVFNWGTAGTCQGYNMATLAQTAATVSSYTRVTLPRNIKSGYTSCKEAITVKEMDAVCDAEGLEHLTVFKQRNLEGVSGSQTIAFNLWTCGPKNSVVVLYREKGAATWQVLVKGGVGVKSVSATVDKDGAYAVCMAW